MDTSFIGVRLYDDSAKIQMAGGVEKEISLENFINLIGKANGDKSKLVETTQDIALPSNVFFLSVGKDVLQLSCYYSETVKQIIYNPTEDRANDMKMRIIMPNTIISHKLKKNDNQWVIDWSKYFCTHHPVSRLSLKFIDRVSHQEGIFIFPMSNTYDDAKMCYGYNSMPSKFELNNLRGLDWYYQYLFESPFNDDLGIEAVRGYFPDEWYDMLQKTAEKGEGFPYKKLIGFPK